MDEFALIADYFSPLATAPGAFGLQDDAATIAARPGFDLVVTTDQIAEGTDFFKHDPPGTIARKALRVSLSDLAAKGATPVHYLLNLSLPAGMTGAWLAAFAGGLAEDQRYFAISLLGGDTSRTEGPLAIAVTAFGFVREGAMLRRAGARPGDGVYVTGCIGDSGGGLAIFRREKHALQEKDRDYLVARYRVPQPPVAFGPALCGLASASADVSDGLIADLGHLANASGIRIVVDAEAIPRSQALRALWGEGVESILRAATTGDDYQIVFTAAVADEPRLRDAANGTPLTRIGTVVTGQGVELRHAGVAVAVPAAGWTHF